MKNSLFCHLHVHDQFSLLDGLGTANQYAQRAKELGFTHLALTNHGNVDGCIKFQQACKEVGIQPIIGCELYCVPEPAKKEKEKKFHATVWVQNDDGWHNLLQMLSKAHLYGFYSRPRVGYVDLVDHCDGLMIGTACVATFLKDPNGYEILNLLLEKTQVYAEIMPHLTQDQVQTNQFVLEIAEQFDLPLIATNDCHWPDKTDRKTQQVLLAIQGKSTWRDPKRFKFNRDYKLHLKTVDEMLAEFEKQAAVPPRFYKDAVLNTMDVAEQCSDFEIKKRPVSLPVPVSYREQKTYSTEESFLEGLCDQGYIDKIGEYMSADYESRLNYELDIIKRKGFVRYFLIVWDLVKWCKANDVMIGPSRGSGGCSLVAYLLDITQIDPLKYDLPFSRFINEERIDLPDFDIDFEDAKRNVVVWRLKNLYGHERVAGISTFLKMKGRLAIRDVARVFGVDLKEVDIFAKSIENSIEEAVLAEKQNGSDPNQWFHKKYPHVVKHAMRLEGQVRGHSRHAAGYIVANEVLLDSYKTHLADRDGFTVVNWEMQDCEYVGLLKLDVLALNTLTVLNHARKLIQKNHGVEINYDKLPLDDPSVFNALSGGNFAGVFQMGYAVQDVVLKAGVSNIMEWSDAIALGRPGPADSGMTAEYIARKHGKEWQRRHPLYEEVVSKTYSVITYQEQIMSVFNKVAGLPYSTADKIRKVIGKKRDASEFEPYKDMLWEGCRKLGTMSPDELDEFWDMLLGCARYVFNLAHSLGYAMLGYWTLWTKVYHPSEFMASFLTHGDDKYKQPIVDDIYKSGIDIVSPKVGISASKEWIAQGGKIYAPFISIRGVGDKMANEIVRGGREKKKSKKKIFSAEISESVLEYTPKTQKILEAIRAFEPEAKLPKDALQYFDLRMAADYREMYPKLIERAGNELTETDINSLLRCDYQLDWACEQDHFQKNPLLDKCKKCSLREECKAPVHPSPAKSNLMIIGEAPGSQENKVGRGFVGDAGNLLWKELLRYNLHRPMFHVTNVVKCYPATTRTPKEEHIEACSEWLDEEIESVKPAIILALGNTTLMRFRGEESGITKKNGTIEWNEKYGCYICWCMHPAAALRGPQNKGKMQEGIRFFSQKLEMLGV